MSCKVQRSEIEWQTPPRYGMGASKPWTWGRVHLWLILECGNTVQRIRTKKKDGSFIVPKQVKCHECG